MFLPVCGTLSVKLNLLKGDQVPVAQGVAVLLLVLHEESPWVPSTSLYGYLSELPSAVKSDIPLSGPRRHHLWGTSDDWPWAGKERPAMYMEPTVEENKSG